MPPVIITEKRFREGTGERYLNGGQIRCQALAKNKLRRWREEHNDLVTPNEELWPECQCERPAEPGMFACYWHGGPTPRKDRPKSIFDVMPLDLGEKLKRLMENNDYISRREDIQLMQARKWEILERLRDNVSAEEAWGIVYDAFVSMRQGKLVEAEQLLKQALEFHHNEEAAWHEIKDIERLVGDLTKTEVKSAKDLKMMATADQVAQLINHLYGVLNRGVEKYLRIEYLEGCGEQRAQAEFLQYFAGELYKSANISPVTLGLLTDASGGT